MPKKVSKIPAFNKGIVSNPPARDIPDGAFSYASNVDTRAPGLVRGIQGETQVSTAFTSEVMAPLYGATDYLIGQKRNGQFELWNIDAASQSLIGSALSSYAKVLVPTNQQVYGAMVTSLFGDTPTTPKWIGKLDNPPFGMTSEYVVADAECKSFADSQSFNTATSPLISLGNMPGSDDNDNRAAVMNGSGKVFEAVYRYFWAVSLVYDGFQESPLIFGEANSDLWYQQSAVNRSYADLMVRLAWNTGDLPGRLTGIKIYRARAPEDAEAPSSSYQLIAFIDDLSTGSSEDFYNVGVDLAEDLTTTETDVTVTDGSMFADGDTIEIDGQARSVSSVSGDVLTISSPFSSAKSTGDAVLLNYNRWAIGGDIGFPGTSAFDNQYFFRVRDDGSAGADYRDNTGIAETLESTSVDYSIAADYSGYLFVAGANKAGVSNSEKYIFRSKPKSYSIFDWSEDFTILPERPVALAGFNGRLYAFGTANMYRINPLSLEVEDTYRGVGALNENCVITTNFGMFHADDSNIYINDGRTSTPIGTPILEMDGGGAGQSGWTQAEKSNSSNEDYAKMAYDPVNKRVLLFVSVDSSNTGCWAYDVEFQVWAYYDQYPVPSTTAVGPNGILYAVLGNTTDGFDLQTLFTNATRKLWTIRTKDFDLGSDSGYFYGYDLHGYGSGNFVIKYLKDGSGTATSPGTSSVGELRKATVAPADKKMRSIALEVEAAAAGDELDNLTIQLRPQIIQE